jgi:hypothetical protein
MLEPEKAAECRYAGWTFGQFHTVSLFYAGVEKETVNKLFKRRPANAGNRCK